jgi:hypothetical protein
VLQVPEWKRPFSALFRDFFIQEKRSMVSKDLLDILACPRCKEKVVLDEDGQWLVCGRCAVKYPIEEDIPVMLVDRAVDLER